MFPESKNIKIVLVFSIFSLSLIGFSHQLDCTPIAITDEVAGKILKLPANSENPVALPANFQCAYTIYAPTQVFAKITITNSLKNVNDVIFVTDWTGDAQKIDRNSPASMDFYVFPKTSTTVNITNGPSADSKLLVTISYVQLPNPTKISLQAPPTLNYFLLPSIQLQPITVTYTDKLTLTIARFNRYELYDNYFVIDGDFSSSKASIAKFNDFESFRFGSSGNTLTFVGLKTDAITKSSVLVNPSSDVEKYTKFAGISVDSYTADNNVHLGEGQKAAVVVVARDPSKQLVLTKLVKDTTSSCRVTTVTGPPSSSSKTLIDYTSTDFSIPQLFPFSYFTFLIENCALTTFAFNTVLPTNYYQLDATSSGYIFSPSYFNEATGKADFNVTYAYTGDDKKVFSIDVDDVTVDSNGQLDVNIYDDKWQKTLSAVITGNQIGTSSKAYGKYLNVRMAGKGTAKLRYQLSDSVGSVFTSANLIISSALLFFWISSF